jgi:acyl transferase domain-containing protein
MEPLQIGSIKTNVGHLEGSSGLTGVIKTILMLEKEQILPNSDFKNPNKRIPMDKWNLQVFNPCQSAEFSNVDSWTGPNQVLPLG